MSQIMLDATFGKRTIPALLLHKAYSQRDIRAVRDALKSAGNCFISYGKRDDVSFH